VTEFCYKFRNIAYPSSQRLISLYLITIYFNTSFLILFMFAMPTTRSLTVALNPPLVPPLDALNPLKVELDGEEVLVFACRPRSALHLCVRSVCAICVCVRYVCLPFVFVICVCDLCACVCGLCSDLCACAICMYVRPMRVICACDLVCAICVCDM
jgi:hypothetical protein